MALAWKGGSEGEKGKVEIGGEANSQFACHNRQHPFSLPHNKPDKHICKLLQHCVVINIPNSHRFPAIWLFAHLSSRSNPVHIPHQHHPFPFTCTLHNPDQQISTYSPALFPYSRQSPVCFKMADSTAVASPFAAVDSVRLSVEPVQVPLEDGDGSLLFSALQSAFPNSSGVYFRRPYSDCRVALKFDGRRFLAPNGGWNTTTEYFVELGGSRHNPFPFGSYEQASKQFERSVNLVQQMMNGAGRRKQSGRESEHTNGTSEGEHQPRVESCPRRPSVCSDGTPNCSLRDAKCLERDFTDLARICAGKDAVIDGQRAQLDEIGRELDALREGQTGWKEKEAEWRGRLEAAQMELDMLRALGRDQQELHGQIVELTRQLEETRRNGDRTAAEAEAQLRQNQREAADWREKNELSVWTVNELTEQLKKLQRERSDLHRKTAILEEQVNGEAMEFGRRFQERERIQQELLTDNTRLYQIKDQLETQCRELTQQLERSRAETDTQLGQIRAELEARVAALLGEVTIAKSKLAESEAKCEQLEEARMEAEEKLDKLVALPSHSQLASGEALFSYSQD